MGFTSAYAAPTFAAGSCAGTRAGATLNCTANDVQLTEVNITNANSCILGDFVTVSFDAKITAGKPKRYDIGVFISNDGKDPTVFGANGAATCSVFSVNNTPQNLADGFQQIDGDSCLEAPNNSSAVVDDFTSIQVPCIPDANGNLTLNTVVTWDNTAGNVCNGPNDVFANTGSKCNKQVITTDIPVFALGTIIIRKETQPDAAIDSFGFTSTGIQAPATDPGCNPALPNTPDPVKCPTTPGPFSLTDGQSKTLNVGTISQNGSTFTVTEDAIVGWGVASITCTLPGGGAVPAGVVTANQATRTLTANLNFTTTDLDCTFTNAQGGSLTVQKNVQDSNPPGGEVAGADYSITVNCGNPNSTFTLENGGTQGFSSINTDTVCVVSEGALPAANPGFHYGTPTVLISGTAGSDCAPAPPGSTACQQFTMPGGGIINASVTNSLVADPASVTVTKSVTGATAGLVPGSTFGITIDCNVDPNSQGGTSSGTPQNNGQVSLASALAGSTCQAYETSQAAPVAGFQYQVPTFGTITGVSGTASCNPAPAGALACVQFTADPGATVAIQVLNNLIVLPGDIISVSKAVTNKPGSYDANTLFAVTIDCGANFTDNLQLKDGDNVASLSGVPGNTLCVVSEGAFPTPPTGYIFGTPSITITGATQVACASPPAGNVVCQQFIMPPGAGLNPPPPVTIAVSNPLVATDGGITVTKNATGQGVVAGSLFALAIDCGAGGTNSGNVASGASVSLNSVAAGSICLISEGTPLPAAAAGYSYGTPTIVVTGATQGACGNPPAGNAACQQFTMPAGGAVTATVTNPTTPNPGNVVTISKTVTGNLNGYVANSTFDITVVCGGTQVIASLANGGSQAGPGNVPAGTQCTASEAAPPAPAAGFAYGTPSITVTGGATSPITCNNAGPCNFIVPPGGSVTVAVTNPVSANGGQVSLTKTVSGNRAGLILGTLFHFTLSCEGLPPFEFTLEELVNGPDPNSIPAGTVCQIVEDSPPSPLLGYFWQTSGITITGATGTACPVPQGFACRQFTMPAGGVISISANNVINQLAVPPTSIPALGFYELLALMALLLAFGLVAVPRYLRSRG